MHRQSVISSGIVTDEEASATSAQPSSSHLLIICYSGVRENVGRVEISFSFFRVEFRILEDEFYENICYRLIYLIPFPS